MIYSHEEVICDATPDSLDLRKRVVGFVEADHSQHASATRFGASVSFVVKLMKNYQKPEV